MSDKVHGEKLEKLLSSKKLPANDIPRVQSALQRYNSWILSMKNAHYSTIDEAIESMVALLNEYKRYIDVDLIFDSPNDFLYRQKGQLKLDNTVMEEFLPILMRKCLDIHSSSKGFVIKPQTAVYSSTHFESSLATPVFGGGFKVKTKDQDFSICRPLHLESSHNEDMSDSVRVDTYIGYVCAELKTNLDKTMFQEASATAHDVKVAVSGAKYYLLADFLDMTPISTSTTDIEEILILRKAKRISASVRSEFSTHRGRVLNRDYYTDYLDSHPYSIDIFKRFVVKVLAQVEAGDLSEEQALESGWF